MKLTQNFKRILSALLVIVLVFSLMPVTALAAESSRTSDTIFFATDRHEESSKLNSLLKALAYEPGLVVLGGDHVNNTNSGSLASITNEIQSVYPGVQTFYTYAAHDKNVSADSSNPYAYARTGEYYTGEDYYVYAIDQDHMQSSSSASSAASNFISWASSTDSDKVIFVVCHMPIHQRRGDNAGGATWMNALNQVGQSRDVVYLWGHNHTGENSSDTSVYYVARGGSLTPQGGSTGTINFTYMNAGYIKNGYATMALINDDNVTFVRYNTSGSATATNTMERQFAGHTHSWTVSSTVAATCGKAGSTTYTCSCGDSYSESIPATGNHTNTTETVAPTCTENGSVTTTCTVCGETTVAETNALGHSYSALVTDATCTENGSAIYTCTVCGDTYTEVIEATGHDYESVVTDPTNTEEGYTTHTCKVCGDVVVDSFVSPLGHNYEAVIQEPTCTEDGSIVYTCTDCGDSYTEVLSALGHCYETITIKATCTEDGSVSSICIDCGEIEPGTEVEVIPSTGHSYVTETQEATCTKDGSVVTSCVNCGEAETEVIPATGHTYTSVTLEPTCTNYGYTTYTCNTCGYYYNNNAVAPLGHSYESTVTAPTCTTEGFTTNICTVCNNTTVTDTVAALGHNYIGETSDDGKYVVYTCTNANCESSYSEEISGAFTYEKVTKFTTGDYFVITLYSNKNYYALSHKDNQLSVVPVTVSNNEITSDVTEDMLWQHYSKKLYYNFDGTTYYLTAPKTSLFGTPTLRIGTSSPATVTFSSSKLKVSSYYLRLSNNVVSLNRSATTTYLYKQAE